MRRSDDTLTSIGDENRRTIRDAHADCDRRIVGHRRICFRPWTWDVLTLVHDGHLRAVHLSQQQHAIGPDVNLPSHGVPLVARIAQLKVRDREEMIGDVGKWAATQDGAPFSLRPLETVARLGLNHDYPRIGN